MPDMTLAEFDNRMKQTGSYETDASLFKSWVFRGLGRSDFWFYFQNFLVVLHGYRAARKGEFTDRTWAACSFRTLQLVEKCGGSLRIDIAPPARSLPSPVVYISNHMSMLETFLLPCILLPFGRLTTVVKNSLLQYPFFGEILRATEAISVNRQNPRADLRAVLERGCEMIRKGRSVLIFPQATRSATFHVAHFNSLGVKLAARAGVPAVPMALKTDFQRIGRLSRDFGPLDRSQPIRVSVGAPMPVSGNGRVQHEQIVHFITDRLRSWSVSVDDRPQADGEAEDAA